MDNKYLIFLFSITVIFGQIFMSDINKLSNEQLDLIRSELNGSNLSSITPDANRDIKDTPINEITIAGNFKDMFQNITLANDLEFRYATNSPTMMIEGMVVAGK